MKQEGQKPCQIISAELEIGGSIERNASNGNTNVMINNREITKAELWMLQVCALFLVIIFNKNLFPDSIISLSGKFFSCMISVGWYFLRRIPTLLVKCRWFLPTRRSEECHGKSMGEGNIYIYR